MSTSNFQGKTVLITGAAGGIGRATCLQFARAGATIIATDLKQDGLNALLHELNHISASLDSMVTNTPIHHKTFVGNLTDGDFADQLVANTYQHCQHLDILVNNAGIIRRGNILDTSDEDWYLNMSVNVESVFRMCRATIARMCDQKTNEYGLRGAIVNLASCWGLYPGPNHVAYCTSKAAVAALTQCLARDHAPDGIRVNAVCPNEVNTPMLKTGFAVRGLDPESAIQELNETVPIGRVAEPEDIADIIQFLASDSARYLCGALIEANGAKPVG